MSDGNTRYRSNEVAKIAGVTLRQLQYWDEMKVLSPQHVSHVRWYSRQDLLKVVVSAWLRRKGLSLRVCRRVLRRMAQKEYPANSGWYLVTDGYRVYFEKDHRKIVEIIQQRLIPMTVVGVELPEEAS